MIRFLFLSLFISCIALGQTNNPLQNTGNGLNRGKAPDPDPVADNVGTGGVELSEIPISLSSGCDSMLLKGAKTFANTAFLMPKGKVAIDEYQKHLIEVVPIKGTSNYNLRITMSFADVLRNPLAENSLATKIIGCDYEELKFKVNNYLSNIGDGVDTLATLPVSNMGFAFSLHGKVFTAKLGTDKTNSLNYLKEANILEFVLTRDDLDDFLELVNGRLGLNVDVDVNFTAKREVGGVFVSVDNKALAREIQAKLGVNYDLANLKKVAAADLRTALESSVNTTTATIQVEGGPDIQAQMFEISQRILMSILQAGGFCSSQNGLGNGLLPGLPSSGGSYNRRNMGCQNSITDWKNKSTGSIFDQQAQPTPRLPRRGDPVKDPKLPSNSSDNLIDAKAFLSTLNDSKNFTFNYKIMGSAQAFNYRTSTNMKLNIGDLFLKTTTFSTSETRNMPWFLKAGESFTFYVSRKIVNALKYTERKNYYNRSDIMNDGELRENFDILAGVEDHELENVKDLNEVKAVYEWSKKTWVQQPGAFWKVPVTIKGSYYWGAYTYELKNQKIMDKEIYMEDQSELLELPIRFRFTRTGNRPYPMKKIFSDNPYWSATFDSFTGAVTITAKVELGVPNVENLGSGDMGNVTLTAGYFQEYKGTKSKTFKKVQQYSGKYPKKEEIIEITTSRFWGDPTIEADLGSLNLQAKSSSPF